MRDAQLQIRVEDSPMVRAYSQFSICASPQNRSLRSQAWISKITLVLLIAWSRAVKPGG